MDEVRATLEDATRRSDGARVVLGSVHFLGDWAFDDPHTWRSGSLATSTRRGRSTSRLWCDACRTGLFDVMAHPDLVKKFGHLPSFDPRELYAEAARVAAEAGS